MSLDIFTLTAAKRNASGSTLSYDNLEDKPFYTTELITVTVIDSLTANIQGNYNVSDEDYISVDWSLYNKAHVILDNIEYELSIMSNGYGSYYVGNPYLDGMYVYGEDNGYDFVIIKTSGNKLVIYVRNSLYGEHTFSLSLLSGGDVIQIDEKYIPSTFQKTESENLETSDKTIVGAINELNKNVTNADWSVEHENLPGFVYNKTHFIEEVTTTHLLLNDYVVQSTLSVGSSSSIASEWKYLSYPNDYRVKITVGDEIVYYYKISVTAPAFSESPYPTISSEIDSDFSISFNANSFTYTISCKSDSQYLGKTCTFSIAKIDGYTYHSLDEKFIPDTIPKIQTATVGQVVSVKAVDENSAPTEWEAVDMTSGGSYCISIDSSAETHDADFEKIQECITKGVPVQLKDDTNAVYYLAQIFDSTAIENATLDYANFFRAYPNYDGLTYMSSIVVETYRLASDGTYVKHLTEITA